MSKKNILITGADGFIGSHLVEELVLLGWNVKALVLYNSLGRWGWLENCNPIIKNNFEIIAGDIRDPFFVKNVIKNCDYVIHLAALIAIPYSYSSPKSYIDTNVVGTLNVLQAAKELGVCRIIHTSTSEVYGTARYVPIDENHPLQGQSPYSASKIGADQIAHSFFASYGIPVVVCRPFNTYGPRQSARAIIPSIIIQILSGATEIKLGSLAPTRDFSYIKDTVSGFIAALDSKEGCGEAVNFGSNYEISIKDTASLIAEILNRDIAIIEDINRVRPKKSEVERLWADNTKAKKLFNWEPKYNGVSGLRLGLIETINWFEKADNLKLYKADIYNI
jgi:NAD dependent epimerase/dehydratase